MSRRTTKPTESRHLDKVSTNPNTPTRITIPTSSEFDRDNSPEMIAPPYHDSSSNSRSLSHDIADFSVDESSVPPMEENGLEQVWEAIRTKKEKKMAKERPKVQSLQEPEEFSLIEGPEMELPVVDPPRPDNKSLRRQKSLCVAVLCLGRVVIDVPS
jgi:hypothetical protein